MKKETLFCTRCFTLCWPKTATKGSFLIELILWLMMIFPGLLYTVWRLTTRQKVCPSCGCSELIPKSSPRVNALLASIPH
jgi:hypothetical protein